LKKIFILLIFVSVPQKKESVIMKYSIFVEGETGKFQEFDSEYEFSTEKNSGHLMHVKKEDKLYSLKIKQVVMHEIRNNEHNIRIDCEFHKFF